MVKKVQIFGFIFTFAALSSSVVSLASQETKIIVEKTSNSEKSSDDSRIKKLLVNRDIAINNNDLASLKSVMEKGAKLNPDFMNIPNEQGFLPLRTCCELAGSVDDKESAFGGAAATYFLTTYGTKNKLTQKDKSGKNALFYAKDELRQSFDIALGSNKKNDGTVKVEKGHFQITNNEEYRRTFLFSEEDFIGALISDNAELANQMTNFFIKNKNEMVKQNQVCESGNKKDLTDKLLDDLILARDRKKQDGIPLPFLALLSGSDESVCKFIESDHDLFVRDTTLLHHAILCGSQSVIDCLIKNSNIGDLINHRGKHGETPLMLGCRFGDCVMVQKLLDAGATINQANYDGEQYKTALDYATTYGKTKVCDFLRACGGKTREELRQEKHTHDSNKKEEAKKQDKKEQKQNSNTVFPFLKEINKTKQNSCSTDLSDKSEEKISQENGSNKSSSSSSSSSCSSVSSFGSTNATYLVSKQSSWSNSDKNDAWTIIYDQHKVRFIQKGLEEGWYISITPSIYMTTHAFARSLKDTPLSLSLVKKAGLKEEGGKDFKLRDIPHGDISAMIRNNKPKTSSENGRLEYTDGELTVIMNAKSDTVITAYWNNKKK